MSNAATGIHKHLHILCLHQYLLGHGYIHPLAPHTRIPGIWAKLETLYDLPSLDEKEDAHSNLFHPDQNSDEDMEDASDAEDNSEEADSLAAGGEGDGFSLPDSDFGEMMWRARFPDADTAQPSRETRSKDPENRARSSSPPLMPELLAGRSSPPVRFAPSFDLRESEEMGEEEATPSKNTAKRPGRPAKGTTKPSKAEVKSGARDSVGRRRTRAADSAATEEEEGQEEEKGEEEVAEEEDEESEEASSEEESGTPAPKAGRGRGGARGRGRPRGKPKRR